MSGETTEAGQVAPVIDEAAQAEAAQTKAATTQAQTDGAEGGEESPEPKTFTQAELDEIVQKRLAKAERKARREALQEFQALRPQERTERQPADEKPTPKEGETNESYIDRLTDWKLEQRDRQATQTKQQEQARTIAQKTDAIYAQAEKLAGFDREEFNELPLTRAIAETLIESDVAPQLMHYMSINPAEVERIAKLSAGRQAAEIGKIEAKLAADPPPKKITSAPQPLNAVRKPSAAAKTYDTTDPRAARDLSTSEWIKADTARLQRKHAGT